ncbi:unnamed protein product [Rotaria magnacalcarata]|uniref:J domain-containing protein n=2 Tax=Rotaria magnacalcarata TaxID=392030 RepID=A0A816VDS1_9BILA|nr:unnamed protein product [Rotaria magnacalcarata]
MDALFTSQPNKSDDYYTILGCNELSNKDQIQAEYRIRALRLHPDKNQDDPNTMDQFKQLQEAKEILSDDVKRKAYDHWRNSHITISWKTWQSITERSQPTFHWIVTKKEPMIESVQMNNKEEEKEETMDKNVEKIKSPWKSAEPANDYLRKFRNYEI